ETPVGFKFIGPRMIETGAMMGAEESGGFGFGMHLPERDGIYADLLLLDLFLQEKAAGRWPVSKAIADFHEIAGPTCTSTAPRTRRSSGASSSTSRRLDHPSSPVSPSPGRSASTPRTATSS